MSLFPVKEVDRRFYQEKLADFLPDKIIDVHTHVYQQEASKAEGQRTVSWPARVASKNPIEDMDETARLLFPGKSYVPLMFGSPSENMDLRAANHYVASVAKKKGYPALMLAHPEMSAADLHQQILGGGFLGIKVYLTFAPRYLPVAEIRIFDFLPHEHLEICNQLGSIVMLHIPRNQRFKDPVNLAQLLEIENKYKNIRLIVAHVGRAYINSDLGDALTVLKNTERMYFDFSANTNDWIFEQLIRAVGSSRILYGSDFPIVRMRMRRVERDGRYVNLVPRGLYGDVSNDPNMGELDSPAADELSFFIYEEIEAFRQAAIRTNLTSSAIENVFYKNAAKMLAAAGFKSIS